MKKLRELFGIDLRSLALFRICLGLIMLADVASRVPDIAAFYTDAGVLPRMSLLTRMPATWMVSIHLMNGTTLVQAFLLGLQAVCAVGLLVGYRTRWMAAACWFLMASLHRRNHMIDGGGDDYLRLLLFWSMFLPMGAQWSLDCAWGAVRRPLLGRAFSWGTAAILLQTAMGYLLAAYHKWDLPVWKEGTAIYYALSIDNYARAFAAERLLQFPSLLEGLTRATLWFELGGTSLLFCPVFTGPVRTLAVFGFLLMHAGFAVSMHLMLFPAVSAAAMVPFLPAWFWDRLVFRQAGARPIPLRSSKLANACAALFLICIVTWNLEAVKPLNYKMPGALRALCNLTNLDQAWRMFAPPAPSGGWFVVPGKLKNGTEVDLFRRGAPVSWEKPPEKAQFPNERWRRYMFNYVFGKNEAFWPDYGQYLCRSWNAGHTGEQQLDSLEIVFMARKTPPPGQTAPYQKRVLLTHSCASQAAPAPSPQEASSITPSRGTRPAQFAGKFYPADGDKLGQAVDHFIANADAAALPGELVAMLVPHAAYEYSGAVAGYGYTRMGKDWTTVVLLGPAHHAQIQGAAVWARGAFSTPLGEVAVDEALAQRLTASSGLIHDSAEPHAGEHSLEVQLPFLQRNLGEFKIVPVLISTTDVKVCRQIGDAIAQAVRGHKALILISSDLSHYPDRDAARRIDQTTLAAVERMNLDLIHRTANLLMKRGEAGLKTTMCGQGALLAGLHAAQSLGANQALVLRYANSGESDHGDPHRAVGYAAVAFLKGTAGAGGTEELPLDEKARAYLLSQASTSIREGLDGTPERPVAPSDNPTLNLPAAMFVTLRKDGRLRGCRGTTAPSQTLLEGVARFAREAAFNDPRFPPLTKEEFDEVRIKLSVLSPLERIDSADRIVPGTHGVMVRNGQRTGLFLPSVWEKFPDKERFLSTLCTQKANLPARCWNDPEATLDVFTTTELEN